MSEFAGPSPRVEWHALNLESVQARVGAVAEGLSDEEVAKRLHRFGPNELKDSEPVNPWAILASQFGSLIVWILIAAGIVSGLFGEWIDALAIAAIVVLNALIGFYQEFSAEKSMAALKRMTAPHARVRRNGTVRDVLAREIVPGDVLVLEAGDLVPADARLTKAASLKCVEAALTGESDAVGKHAGDLDREEVPLGDRKNMVFMGTSVATGSAEALAVATGMATEMGHIAGLIQKAGRDDGTPLQRRLQAFGKLLVWASLGVVGLVFVLGLARGMEVFELFLTAVSLAVAAVPEGLPAVVTISLAVGVQRMARRRALMRRLPTVETLGSTSVICTDKTGTLTVGEMTVRALYACDREWEVTGEGYGPDGAISPRTPGEAEPGATGLSDLMLILAGCNSAHLAQEDGRWKAIGDPTEGALLAVAAKARVLPATLDTEWPRAREFPFDSDRKMMTAIRKTPQGGFRALVKGAPDVLLARCTRVLTPKGVKPLTDRDRERISALNAAWAGRALRVLGAAMKEGVQDPDAPSMEEIESDLVFVGLAGMYDPPRPEAKDAVARCRSAGIRVVMITGDHPRTALAVARELGLAESDGKALTGLELDRLSDAELSGQVDRVAVFARVTAEHKLRIVRAWKTRHAIVAMTGDGVNDAPAIKGADVGIAMGKAGTEVTKEASDMIVADDNFASIVAAVEEGRGIFDNIKKTLQYLLAGNAGELLLMTACVVCGLPMALLPIHLLWINLVTDGLPALCLATDPIDPDVMKRGPRKAGTAIADRGFLILMGATGFLTAAVAFGVYVYGLRFETLEMARTHAFAALVFAELLRSFGCRSETKTLFQVGTFTNLRLAFVVGVAFLFQVWSHHNPVLGGFLKTGMMSWSDCLMLAAVSAIPISILEIAKLSRQFGSVK
ncbi:MAG: cation-translocating P-type ATPase [Planctomycetota bacterium]|nr:cation-translocating P-type ATPase [Planctomycetota bacterium]